MFFIVWDSAFMSETPAMLAQQALATKGLARLALEVLHNLLVAHHQHGKWSTETDLMLFVTVKVIII